MPQFSNDEDPLKNVRDAVNNTADHTSEFDPADIAANKGVCILAYFGILFFIPLVARPNSAYGKYHANQGLLLFVVEVMIGAFQIGLPFVPIISNVVNCVLFLFELLMFVIGIVNVCNSKAKDLPIVGSLRLIN